MAIYHLHAKLISRANGRSAVAAAAYRSASELYDERLQRSHDFSNKADVIHSEILLPEGAPVRLLDRSLLWNEVEGIEKRKDAQLAREVEFSIPREMPKTEAIRLARDFVAEQFVARGMVADLNVHWSIGPDGEAKPHAHVMLSLRRIDPSVGLGVGVGSTAIATASAERERGHGARAGANHGGDPGGGAGSARDGAGDPGADAGGGERGREWEWSRSDRDDLAAAVGHPGDAAQHRDAFDDHRAGLEARDRPARRLTRLVAAARLRLGDAKEQTQGVVQGPEPGPLASVTEHAGFGLKERAWNDQALLLEWRERWAELANERLLVLGLDVRIDHRSYAAQGIDLEPQNKIGPAGARREDRGEEAERAAEHEEIARRNGERIIAEPERVLVAITRQQSTFTRQDLARFVDRHTADAAQFTTAMAVVEASPELVRVGVDGRGRERFSTREMLGVEEQLEAVSYDLAQRSGHGVGEGIRERALADAERTLSGEQRAAFAHVTDGADIAVVVGYAGAGKSTMLGVARVAWEASGYQVRGAALSGIAAEGLEAGAGIESRTLASWEHAWARGRDQLTSRDVLVIDEAGMNGSRQMERVLSAVRDAGAKVVLVGDPEQLQAIEAGAAFRAIAERVGSVEITTVIRQREGWQQQATREFATGRTGEALERYEAAGMVHAHETLDEAKAGLVAGWDAARQQSPQASQIMLAHRRVDVRDLNDQARALRREAGELGVDHVLATGRGERAFAEGDRLYFLKNERSLGVKNGTLGTIERIENGNLTVYLDGPAGAGTGRAVSFDLKDYAEIDHGYAATVHKSQGVTVDRAHVLATPGMDRHMAYVGLSRHRDGVALHWSRDEMGSRDGLDARLGRERLKDTSLDYAPPGRMDAGERHDHSAAPGPAAPQAVRTYPYAERRGLVPESEIILRERQVETRPAQARPAQARPAEAEVGRAVEQPAPRRSKFAGLKLSAAPMNPVRDRTPAASESTAQTRERAPAESRLSRAVGQFAEAVEDARRLVRENLPVLPHQHEAMEAGIKAILAAGPGFVRSDVENTLNARAELVTPAAQGPAGREAAILAIAETRGQRRVLEGQARDAVWHWAALETQYDRAGTAYDWDAQRQVGSQLVAFARDLKRDPQLESLLRERGQDFGVAEGSRLHRVVQAPDLDRALRRDIDIDHGLRRDRGMSLGM